MLSITPGYRPRDRHLLHILDIPGHTDGPPSDIKDGRKMDPTMRTRPLLRAIHGSYPVCIRSLIRLLQEERSNYAQHRLSTVHTFNTRRYTKGSHPGHFSFLSLTDLHCAASKPAVPARTPGMS